MLARLSFSALLTIAAVLAAPAWGHGQSGRPGSHLRPIQQNAKWGYIDSTGKIAIQPQFSWAEEFSEGLAAFENEDGKHGYIDETGKIVNGEASFIYACARDPLKRGSELAVTVPDSNQ